MIQIVACSDRNPCDPTGLMTPGALYLACWDVPPGVPQELLDEIDSTGGWGLLPLSLSLDLDVAGGSEGAGFIPMWSNCSDRQSKVWFIPEE